MWTSPDGTTWQAAASFESGDASSVIEAGPAMAAAGGALDPYSSSHAAVWLGPALTD